MKTIITSSGKGEDQLFDLRFGRAAWFCLYDDTTDLMDFFENKHIDAPSGAGAKVVEELIEMGVNKVISGDFGPKAKDLLEKFNIQMVILKDDHKSIKEIVENFKS
ncbi:NifB/NifX family molybdenum-iron cluster-binding protein [Marinifilum caeruleilacunae]|jgi:predicted Fe-Mo cluster-binding NifX family protein|uniref:Dinitrogenase iron-molybdenum cofactor biosynthesis protein n=1 Tax=Marinifilum caeruleilacunae TaxID=2499076 RepID=A0ABX1WR32_9BACT|nr:NifB/NifX family molybdenum-iron cluster-binding protein [Marinifilum caeruleilacunae]NOU58543.1 dinitrogenase iron-molybdenum cofactor biosynthesis protein [Marinifilum caeruleilacunae]